MVLVWHSKKWTKWPPELRPKRFIIHMSKWDELSAVQSSYQVGINSGVLRIGTQHGADHRSRVYLRGRLRLGHCAHLLKKNKVCEYKRVVSVLRLEYRNYNCDAASEDLRCFTGFSLSRNTINV